LAIADLAGEMLRRCRACSDVAKFSGVAGGVLRSRGAAERQVVRINGDIKIDSSKYRQD